MLFSRETKLKLKSDNSPSFNSKKFKDYLAKLGVEHEISTPEWPQGNSEVEAFMKPLAKAIKAARSEHRNWVQELSRFLLSYRTTPHCSTNVPPAQLLFNRPVKGTLPTLNPKAKVLNKNKDAKTNDSKAKDKGRDHVAPSEIQVGDTVILKQRKKNKFTTKFKPIPYTVLERRRVTIVAENQRHKVTVSFFKKISEFAKESDDEDVWDAPRVDTRIERAEREADKPAPEEPVMRRSTRQRRQRELYRNAINPNLIIR